MSFIKKEDHALEKTENLESGQEDKASQRCHLRDLRIVN